MPREFRVVGKSVPLGDSREKVTGEAKFTADIRLPGMLHAKVLGSPHPHAQVKKIDVSKAEALRGVGAVITCKDVPKVAFYPSETRELYALTDHPRCIGDEVAAVAAETEELAEEALELIDVKYEVLAAVFDPVEGAKPDAPKLYPEGNISDAEAKPLLVEWGELDRAFQESDVSVEDTFKTQIQVTTAMEPRSCVARWDGDGLTAWVSTQFPHRVREDLARVLSLPLNKVRVISTYVGGGFGGKKQERYPIITALLAKRAGRPVKLEYTRKDEHTIGRRRYSSVAHVKMGAKKDGTITAIDFECFYDVGAYGNATGGSLFFLISEFYVYKFKNARFKAWDVNTNLITAQPFRSVQFPALHFAIEQLIDQIAEKLQVSPVEVRLKNTYRMGDRLEPFGATLSTYAIEECVEKSLNAIGWRERWKGWGTPVEVKGPKRRGIGIATSMGWCDWEREQTAATVKIERDGTAELITGTQDIGTGSSTTLRQIVAEELGLNFEDVGIVTGDTKVTPHDYACCASRTLYIGGTAAKGAAADAKRKIFELVAPALGVKPEELELRDKRVYVRDIPEKSVPLSEILTSSVSGECRLEPTPTVAPLREKLYKGAAIAHVVEVEVDVETGEIKILKHVVAHDIGKAINPAVVENQLYGGAIQGIGYTLTEALIFDAKNKVYLNPDYLDYKILTTLDTPVIQPIIVESMEPTGPFGGKGTGEHAFNPTAGAIANAVYNAIGVRIKELPITPERVLEALGGYRARKKKKLI